MVRCASLFKNDSRSILEKEMFSYEESIFIGTAFFPEAFDNLPRLKQPGYLSQKEGPVRRNVFRSILVKLTSSLMKGDGFQC